MDTAKPQVRIFADDRENAGGVIAALEALDGVAVEVRRLDCADYLVEERFAVERKTLRDFAASIIDGRVFRQASAMARSALRGVLVLEGDGGDLQAVGVRREALQGALIHLGVFLGLAVLRSRDPLETARLLLYLGRQAQTHHRGALARSGYRPKGWSARQLFLLQGLPRVGSERAARLLDRFGSVEAVMTASAAELATIDGIGAATASRIRWALGSAENTGKQAPSLVSAR
jgi:ERCC4-type nuclease